MQVIVLPAHWSLTRVDSPHHGHSASIIVFPKKGAVICGNTRSFSLFLFDFNRALAMLQRPRAICQVFIGDMSLTQEIIAVSVTHGAETS
jgi:hypothetical protein